MAQPDMCRVARYASPVPMRLADAAACGFTDIDTFRRAFQRRVGVTPAEYRHRYELAEAA
jgi:AraC-like DNA-binding protein